MRPVFRIPTGLRRAALITSLALAGCGPSSPEPVSPAPTAQPTAGAAAVPTAEPTSTATADPAATASAAPTAPAPKPGVPADSVPPPGTNPLSEAEGTAARAPYGEGIPVVWVQEEPENMGAWRYLKARFNETIGARHPFGGVSREASSSPATGSPARHKFEQGALIAQAFGTEE